MAQFSLAKPLQPKYNSTTRYLPIFLDTTFVSALKTIAYERPKFDNVFNAHRQLVSDISRHLVTWMPQ
jgi:hypothetical protein